MSRTAVIAGVGPTLGEALAHRFTAEGCAVALLSRSPDYIADLADSLGDDAIAVPTDITDPDEVHDVFERVWRVRAYGSFLCAQEAARDMVETGSGTVLFSGTSFGVRGSKAMPEWGSAGFAARGLARSMARALAPEGVHVTYVALDGPIGPSDAHDDATRADTMLDRDAIAETYWRLVDQPESAWTMELDLGTDERNPEF